MSEVDTVTQVAMNIKLQADTKEYVKHILHELLQNETLLLNMSTIAHVAQRLDGNFEFQRAVKNAVLTQLNKY